METNDAGLAEFMRQEVARLTVDAEHAAAVFESCSKNRHLSTAVLRAVADYADAMTAAATAAADAHRKILNPDAQPVKRKRRRKAGLTDDARETILRLAASSRGVKNATLAGALGVDRATTFRYLTTLKREGLVEMRGQSRAAAWHLIRHDAR